MKAVHMEHLSIRYAISGSRTKRRTLLVIAEMSDSRGMTIVEKLKSQVSGWARGARATAREPRRHASVESSPLARSGAARRADLLTQKDAPHLLDQKRDRIELNRQGHRAHGNAGHVQARHLLHTDHDEAKLIALEHTDRLVVVCTRKGVGSSW